MSVSPRTQVPGRGQGQSGRPGRVCSPRVSHLVSLVGLGQLPVEGLVAELGEGAEGELGALGHGLHGEAPRQAAVPLRVHQGKALEVPRGEVGVDLAAEGGAGVSLA